MSLEPRISLLLDDASNHNQTHSNWSSHPYSQRHEATSQTSSGNGGRKLGKVKVSLAEVLNAEKQPRTPADDVTDFALPLAKRQCFEDASSTNFVTLPKPEVKKKDRRPRIPPLLQGLHQPPPNAGLFPPITADGNHEAAAPSMRQDLELEAEAKVKAKAQDLKEIDHDVAAKTLKVAEDDAARKTSQTRQPRKKNKWTKEETADLLKGVAKFGMGNWKAILSHEEYSFHGRSAIDLKDRFRTCCPEEYRKHRDSDRKSVDSKDQTPSNGSPKLSETTAKDNKPAEPSTTQSPKPKSSRSHRMNSEDLAELGIEAPFTKKKRRERRVWTEEEDAALLKGLSEYGAQWAQIRIDSELGLSHRQPTDLRDRVRNRWPEKYVEAGLVIKPKETPRPVQRVGKAPEMDNDKTTLPHAEQQSATPKDARGTGPTINTSSQDSSSQTSRAQPPPPPLKLLNAPIPNPLVDDFQDLESYDEIVPASPITLDRSIFDWVNQNSSMSHPHSANPTNSFALPSTIMADPPLNGCDNLHIDPLVTLNKPYKHSITNTVPPLISPPSLHSLNFGTPASSTSINNNTSNPLVNALPSMSLGNASTNAPNKIAANGSVNTNNGTGALNLPPPSEVLAGFIDSDVRADSHVSVTAPLLFDDLLN